MPKKIKLWSLILTRFTFCLEGLSARGVYRRPGPMSPEGINRLSRARAIECGASGPRPGRPAAVGVARSRPGQARAGGEERIPSSPGADLRRSAEGGLTFIRRTCRVWFCGR